MDSFRHQGSTVSSDGPLDKEVAARTQKDRQELGRLRVKSLQHKGIRLPHKLEVYSESFPLSAVWLPNMDPIP